MSLMERRLQLLLDRHRFSLVEAEAARTGRSVAAVIREAIDWRFSSDASVRMSAARQLLAMSEDPEGEEPDWAESKTAMADALDRYS